MVLGLRWAQPQQPDVTPGQDIYPVWAPNGQRLIFASERVGTFNLYWQSADGTGVERLTTSTNVQFPTAISPDGRG